MNASIIRTAVYDYLRLLSIAIMDMVLLFSGLVFSFFAVNHLHGVFHRIWAIIFALPEMMSQSTVVFTVFNATACVIGLLLSGVLVDYSRTDRKIKHARIRNIVFYASLGMLAGAILESARCVVFIAFVLQWELFTE